VALPTIAFYDIKEHNAALVDASSIVEFCSLTYFTLTTPFRKWRDPVLLDEVIRKSQSRDFPRGTETRDRGFASVEEYSLAKSLSLLERLCAHEAPQSSLFGRGEPDRYRRCALAGAQGYVGKPFDPDDLIAALRKVLSKV
jgi:hypothetical protein